MLLFHHANSSPKELGFSPEYCPFSDALLHSSIARGATSRVYRATAPGSTEADDTVLKIVYDAAIADNEVAVLRKLRGLAEPLRAHLPALLDYEYSEEGKSTCLRLRPYARSIRDVDRTLAIFSDFVDTIEAAYKLGIRHRDIRPENFL